MSSNTSPLTLPLDETITGNGFVVENDQTVDAGNVETHTTFETVDPASDVQVTMDLSASIISYYEDTEDSETAVILTQITDFAGKIQCSDFHGKGTLEDYNALFSAAAKIANESKQMELDVDIEGFEEFANAAEDLSKLFSSFIVKLENVSIINDIVFLRAVANALEKIWMLSETFGRFKETILATSKIQIPKSAHQAKLALETVFGQINCAMKYINHFVDSEENDAPVTADLSAEEKGIIQSAVDTIDNWNVLCEQGVSIAMSTHPDIEYISGASVQMKEKANALKNATLTLKNKLKTYNL